MRDRWSGPRDGRDGRDGESVDLEALRVIVDEAVKRAAGMIPAPRNGRDGKDGVAVHGKDGERGPRGPAGPLGPMPAHRWRGTRLQFEQAPGGEWGSEVDLQGPRGETGLGGAGGGTVVIGGAGTASGWFPGGW